MDEPTSRPRDDDDFVEHNEGKGRRFYNAIDALADLDTRWYGRLNPRYMDLIGDYAGMEPFVIDGDSLCELVLNDPLLAIGKKEGGTVLFAHLALLLTFCMILSVVNASSTSYSSSNKGLSVLEESTGIYDEFREQSRHLARSMLRQHIATIPDLCVMSFLDDTEPAWKTYVRTRKPMFVMCNSGGHPKSEGPHAVDAAQRALHMRKFIFNLLSNGVAVASLDSMDVVDSKIMTFVYEQRRGRDNRYRALEFNRSGSNFSRPSFKTASHHPIDRSHTTKFWISEAIHQLLDGENVPSEDVTTNTIFYLFIAHALLLPHIAIEDRAQSYPHLHPTLHYDQHWHNRKKIDPQSGSQVAKQKGWGTASIAGVKNSQWRTTDEDWAKMKRERAKQRQMMYLMQHTQSLTGANGAVLEPIHIATTGVTVASLEEPALSTRGARIPRQAVRIPNESKSNGKKAPVLTTKQKLLEQIKSDKASGGLVESQKWWKTFLAGVVKKSVQEQRNDLEAVNRKRSSDPCINVEMVLYLLHLEVTEWNQSATRELKEVKDRHAVQILVLVRRLADASAMYPAAANFTYAILRLMGFEDLRPLEDVKEKKPTTPQVISFSPIVSPSTKTARYPFMQMGEHHIQFQLRHFGLHMDRSMNSSSDSRVTFEPDAWQKRTLDLVDARCSILVVAPTSAGKTFVSFYAMEKVLRESDNGIAVYVAPTKALVNQMLAETSARFSKKMESGTLWAAHTRDYRINEPQKTQILITVPEMLAIMLLSPVLAKSWIPRLRWIILDEIHSIGQLEGGAVWEQLILMAPCPIIGLSATVGNIYEFNRWLGSVQNNHGFEHVLMAQTILHDLTTAEEDWRRSSPIWQQKLTEWRAWKARQKIRDQEAERAKKSKPDDDAREFLGSAHTWHETFDEGHPSVEFSFAGLKYGRTDLEDDIHQLRWPSPSSAWSIRALERGIAVHHAGMPKNYRSLVESVLGELEDIGNVVFYGLPIDRVYRLMTSKIPPLTGNMPLTITLSLRLCNLLHGSENAKAAVNSIKSFLELTQLTVSSDSGREEVLHQIRFSMDYLRRSGLLDEHGRPLSGVIHKICSTIDTNSQDTLRELVLLMSHLFGRRKIPRVLVEDSRVLANLRVGSPSMIILPPMPKAANTVLLQHDKEILMIFRGYAATFAQQHAHRLGPDNALPLTGVMPTSAPPQVVSAFQSHLRSTANHVSSTSAFVATSGIVDNGIGSVESLVRTVRSGIHLNKRIVPPIAALTDGDLPLNAYILDFYKHGQEQALHRSNMLRVGDIWFALQDFSMAIAAVQMGLENYMAAQRLASVDGGEHVDDVDEVPVDDLEEKEGMDTKQGSLEELWKSHESGATEAFPTMPLGTNEGDWKVYRSIVLLRKEFDEKWRATWA
ncbi:hypothetical protein FRB98_007452 [Tulasnella sp. 332]|nr:hypothetical protein FRB98_007452 [Tulasnella sp. 332]